MGKIEGASIGENNALLESGELQRNLVYRFPTKRGNIKKQIFVSVGQCLVELLKVLRNRGGSLGKQFELLKALRKRGGSLGKQRYFVIAALWKMLECRKGNTKAPSFVETLSMLWSEGVHNWYESCKWVLGFLNSERYLLE